MFKRSLVAISSLLLFTSCIVTKPRVHQTPPRPSKPSSYSVSGIILEKRGNDFRLKTDSLEYHLHNPGIPAFDRAEVNNRAYVVGSKVTDCDCRIFKGELKDLDQISTFYSN